MVLGGQGWREGWTVEEPQGNFGMFTETFCICAAVVSWVEPVQLKLFNVLFIVYKS